MQRKSLDVWVGLFVVFGVAALMFLALKAGNSGTFSLAKTYEITAKFDNIGSLRPQAAVKASGVVVGRVARIAFDDKSYKAAVTLEMDATYKFPKDSSAKILTAGLLGEQYVGIEAGGDENNLAQGDKIARTQSAAVLEDLINQFIYSKAAEGKDSN
ncbi:outer membrane lipid asymmetry maintenance protein MlaD [Massilia dura]|uniref:Outer membrane lipid asymmetry maintenance protein MlaD n=1 Tax=Pseudoduganella dura TaxID=321982 RepID=A0A6I3XGJ2_9BURK|nr:outer membrane lipid asymmetry maintenance protein MlaD [Pseudoduganella dura]MUI13650.1 outer membrane lipid asymmetry maintenance protein MlaD [Pseudoduganella dura]GGX74382.1 outer membrane lipid asymmetry maintenance protein MlaD [Pseudoduganella dura]